AAALRSADPWSPWHSVDGWRLNGTEDDLLHFRDGGETVTVRVSYRKGGWGLGLPGGALDLAAQLSETGTLVVDLGGRRMTATVLEESGGLLVMAGGKVHRVGPYDPGAGAAAQDVSGGHLTAPMPGKVVRVLATEGERVRRGTPLIVLEAMKMEHTIVAPADGIVERLAFAVGDLVEEGVELVSFRAEGA